MSNIIKLKRGTGSDPSASDLVVGEVALRTDSGALFTKKDDGNITAIGAADAIGVSGTTSLGTISVSGDANVTLTGFSATLSLTSVIVWGKIIPAPGTSYTAITPSSSPTWTEKTTGVSQTWTEVA